MLPGKTESWSDKIIHYTVKDNLFFKGNKESELKNEK